MENVSIIKEEPIKDSSSEYKSDIPDKVYIYNDKSGNVEEKEVIEATYNPNTGKLEQKIYNKDKGIYETKEVKQQFNRDTNRYETQVYDPKLNRYVTKDNVVIKSTDQLSGKSNFSKVDEKTGKIITTSIIEDESKKQPSKGKVYNQNTGKFEEKEIINAVLNPETGLLEQHVFNEDGKLEKREIKTIFNKDLGKYQTQIINPEDKSYVVKDVVIKTVNKDTGEVEYKEINSQSGQINDVKAIEEKPPSKAEFINKQGQKEKKEVIEASINKDGKLVQKIFDEETGKYVSKEIIQTYDPETKKYVTKVYNPNTN
jgi:hypothetical protein